MASASERGWILYPPAISALYQDAEFSLREPESVLWPTWVLCSVFPLSSARCTRQMAYTGRFFSAAEVARMGLVLEVYPDQASMLEAAKTLAEEIMEAPPGGSIFKRTPELWQVLLH